MPVGFLELIWFVSPPTLDGTVDFSKWANEQLEAQSIGAVIKPPSTGAAPPASRFDGGVPGGAGGGLTEPGSVRGSSQSSNKPAAAAVAATAAATALAASGGADRGTPDEGFDLDGALDHIHAHLSSVNGTPVSPFCFRVWPHDLLFTL